MWAMHTMDIAATAQVLEIGCGRGLAASLVCQRLSPPGRIVALDRSSAMVRLAEQRNAASVANGTAAFLATPLGAARFTGPRFDTVFAMNVNLFWEPSSAPELDVVRAALADDGAMYLFYERPQAIRATTISDRMARFLDAQGLRTTVLHTVTTSGRTVVCVVARPTTSS